MKVVINRCHGGFGLSRKAIDMYCEAKGINPGKWKETWGFYDDFSCRNIERNDTILVQIVEKLGRDANGACADLSVVKIPDDIEWSIHEYDGSEWIAEAHRTWS